MVFVMDQCESTNLGSARAGAWDGTVYTHTHIPALINAFWHLCVHTVNECVWVGIGRSVGIGRCILRGGRGVLGRNSSRGGGLGSRSAGIFIY